MVKTRQKNGLSAEIRIRNHTILADVSNELGGHDAGPNPHEFLEAALAACTTITVQMYANRKAWKLNSCEAEVKFVKEDAEAIEIDVQLDLIGDLAADQRMRLQEIAQKCPVHQVLTRGVKINTSLKKTPS